MIKQPKADHKPNALQPPPQPSAELAAVVGEGQTPRGEVISKVRVCIKAHKLQSVEDSRVIVADDKLRQAFEGAGDDLRDEQAACASVVHKPGIRP